ncbi:hypothetical protein BOTBODRAFT_174183 [Botryobasidium botryosum FD-172 SS1]|uniref:SET domain-containing protein n=1 Tax=Botryobasidium botryosum (strain FD-172 SS1) TaxID=930990 RepID=A0A067MGQ8_BOTB1|nr:hypothetical protein BOTBODRAFT_174183 [Botryobasidium botryosum FD-172 SS1]
MPPETSTFADFQHWQAILQAMEFQLDENDTPSEHSTASPPFLQPGVYPFDVARHPRLKPLSTQHLKDLKEKNVNAEPCAIPVFPRDACIQNLRRARKAAEEKESSPQRAIQGHYSEVGARTHFSSLLLSQLCRVGISDMQAHHVHKGQYLLCRIASGPVREEGVVCFAVEDPAGIVAITLKIHKYPGTTWASTAALDVLFPLGTLLAIREPMVDLSTTPVPQGNVSVYSPADLVFVRPLDPILRDVKWEIPATPPVSRSAAEWKETGNLHFKDGQFYVAAIAYTKGLDVDPDAYILKLNRAAACLRLEYYSIAMVDAEAVLSIDEISDDMRLKARYRTAQAQYGLANYEGALHNFAQCLTVTPGNAEAKEWTERCRRRIHERETGEYDWGRMFRDAQIPGNAIDAEEFIGPIKVGESARGGGRGIFVSKDIKAGDLLLVSKPVVVSFPQELRGLDYELGANLITLETDSVCRQSLITKLVTKIVGDPGLQSDSATPPDLRQIKLPIDVGLIERVIAYNAFNLNDVTRPPCFACTKNLYRSSSALYLLPSLFNHSCSANSTWCNFGDVLVVRATRDVAEGDELTISYIPLEGSCANVSTTYLDRDDGLYQHMDKCDCPECEADRLDGKQACERRGVHLARLRETPEWTVKRAQGLVCDMDATYPGGRTRGRWASARARLVLAEAIVREAESDLERLKEAAREAMKALEENGIVVLDKSMELGSTEVSVETSEGGATLPIAIGDAPIWSDVGTCVGAMLRISSIFHGQGDLGMAKRWLDAACWCESSFPPSKPSKTYRTPLPVLAIQSMGYTLARAPGAG